MSTKVSYIANNTNKQTTQHRSNEQQTVLVRTLGPLKCRRVATQVRRHRLTLLPLSRPYPLQCAAVQSDMSKINTRQIGVNAAIGIANEYNKSLRLNEDGEILRSSDRRRRRDEQLSYLRTISAKAYKHMKYDKNYTPKNKRQRVSEPESGVQVTPYEVSLDESKTVYFRTIKKILLLNRYVSDPSSEQKKGYQFPEPIGELQVSLCYTPCSNLGGRQSRRIYEDGKYIALRAPDVEDLNAIIMENLHSHLVSESESDDDSDKGRADPEDPSGPNVKSVPRGRPITYRKNSCRVSNNASIIWRHLVSLPFTTHLHS